MSADINFIKALKAKLIATAPERAEWAHKSTDFVCPACLALVSDLSHAELTKVFEEIFDAAVPTVVNKVTMQELVDKEARYAVSRIKDKKGKPQILPHINVKYIFAADEQILPATAEKFGLDPKKYSKKRAEGEAAPYTLAKVLQTETTSKNNHAQQIINMVKETGAIIAEEVSKPVANLIIERDLLRREQGTYCVSPSATEMFDSMRAAYVPQVMTYTMMFIVPTFNEKEQKYTYELRKSEREFGINKPVPQTRVPSAISSQRIVSGHIVQPD